MTFYELTAKTAQGKDFSFASLKGKVILIVNTASKCGFTPQFEGLEALYLAYQTKDLVILGFPCDQFLHQEPSDAAGAEQFCKLNFGVTFPIMEKIEVNGKNTHPVFKFLKEHSPKPQGILHRLLPGSNKIKWNFTKFLINREGEIVNRFSPTFEPKKIESYITALL